MQRQSEHDRQAEGDSLHSALIPDDRDPAGPSNATAEESSSRKRRYRTMADYTQRKRVPVACQFCRLRKSKCDNVRPSCTYCLRHKARCVYGDAVAREDTPAGDPIEARTSDQQILERLDEIKDMLQRCNVAQPAAAVDISAEPLRGQAVPSHFATSSESVGQSPFTDVSVPSTGESSGAECLTSVKSPFASFRCESILKWPVLRPIVPDDDTQIDSFLLVANPDSAQGEPSTEEQRNTGHSIRDGSLTPLCRGFLVHFHPRNPILDTQELLCSARLADADGLKWDSSSGLVVSRPTPYVNFRVSELLWLLVCALSVTTQP